ncbi:hypothetical protein DPMN_165284 [Dreissena polymorpha]|uniref:IgGFc-binding protein N-terminal domain-containing protein n=1 Tax=Dreissena polymorpha TaxID=45954 RepID=A0A9D4EUH8_DREPO|nr:hypothetical protein DPMN_165284 [Dreissena polymorpha]
MLRLLFISVLVGLAQFAVAKKTYHTALLYLNATYDSTTNVALTLSTPYKLVDQSCTLVPNAPPQANTYDVKDCPSVLNSQLGISMSGLRFAVDNDTDTTPVIVLQSYGKMQEGYAAIEDAHLGTEYYVGTYCSMGGYCQFAVTPVYNDTNVTVYLPDGKNETLKCNTNAANHFGVPVTLNELEVLRIESTQDLSGTRIVASKNIAVFVGTRHIQSSFMIEQIPPVNKWGTTFVFAPNPRNNAGDLMKIITKSVDTEVSIAGFSSFIIPKTIASVERRIDWGMNSVVRTSRPVLVLHIMSVNLYNGTGNVVGLPSMVLVPDKNHWITSGKVTCPCEGALVVGNAIQATGTTLQYVNTTCSTNFNEISIAGMIYATCNNTAAFLLHSNWAENTTTPDCDRTAAWAGDNIDNNCDGRVDEDTCTELDKRLVVNTAYKEATSNVTSVNIEGVKLIPVTVELLNNHSVAVIKLHRGALSTEDTVIMVTPLQIMVSSCNMSKCNDTNITQASNNGPLLKIQMQIHVQIQSDSNYIHITWPYSPAFSKDTITQEPTEMTLYSATGGAKFMLELMSEDCGKINTGATGQQLDSKGLRFVSPPQNTRSFKILANDKDANVTFFTLDGVTLKNEKNLIVNAGAYEEYQNLLSNTWVFIESNEEIEIWVLQSRDNNYWNSYWTRLIPTDVLSSGYKKVSIAGSDCTHVNYLNYNNGILEVTTGASIEYTWNKQTLAMFCKESISDTDFIQIPPPYTLGKEYFIPKLDIDATVFVQSIEDSNFVLVNHTYDMSYAPKNTDLSFNIALIKNTILRLNSVKPVYVLLKVNNMRMFIPPTDQFSDSCRKDFQSIGESHKHFCVTKTGQDVSNNDEPCYCIIIKEAYYKGMFFASDQLYKTTNPVCTLSDSSDADGKDNDCDGLVDEDNCTDVCLAGEVDADIDGAVNEDCNQTVPNSKNNTVESQTVPCWTAPPDNNVTFSSSRTSEVSFTDAPEPTIPEESHPGLKIPVPTGKKPNLSSTSTSKATTTLAPSHGNTTNLTTQQPLPPEEECFTDCYCPCGWVAEPVQYTKEELNAIVEKIQEKLKIEVKKLSSTTRKLNSAEDQRPSAKAVGVVGLVFLVITLGGIFLLDLKTLADAFRTLLDNVRQPFRQ